MVKLTPFTFGLLSNRLIARGHGCIYPCDVFRFLKSIKPKTKGAHLHTHILGLNLNFKMNMSPLKGVVINEKSSQFKGRGNGFEFLLYVFILIFGQAILG